MTVPSLKGLVHFSQLTQGLTTPTRAKAARVGDPDTPWASIVSPLRGWSLSAFFHCGKPIRRRPAVSEGPHYPDNLDTGAKLRSTKTASVADSFNSFSIRTRSTLFSIFSVPLCLCGAASIYRLAPVREGVPR